MENKPIDIKEAIKLAESEIKLLWEELDKLTKVVKVMSVKLKKNERRKKQNTG